MNRPEAAVAKTKKRLFIAVDISDAAKERLRSAQVSLTSAIGSVRWVRPTGMHLTLAFLGYVDLETETKVKQALANVAAKTAPYNFIVRDIGGFPAPGRPRVIWAGVTDGGQTEDIAHALQPVLATIGFLPEEREFTPHITLGRIKRPRSLSDGEAFSRAAGIAGSSQEKAVELVLYQSVLRRAGAEYTAVERFRFREAD
jgi:RNA 2',3'-cyclic 3'-phosphodiesterase